MFSHAKYGVEIKFCKLTTVFDSWRIVSRRNWPNCNSDLTKKCRHCTHHWLVSLMQMLNIRQRNVNEHRNQQSLLKPNVVNTYSNFTSWN